MKISKEIILKEIIRNFYQMQNKSALHFSHLFSWVQTNREKAGKKREIPCLFSIQDGLFETKLASTCLLLEALHPSPVALYSRSNTCDFKVMLCQHLPISDSNQWCSLIFVIEFHHLIFHHSPYIQHHFLFFSKKNHSIQIFTLISKHENKWYRYPNFNGMSEPRREWISN